MAKPTLALIPASQGSKLFSVLPSSGVGDFDFSRGSAATRINSQGLIENVVSGQSRLSYPLIDGKVVGCPHHILEPARTNLVTYSEDFSNPNWTKTRCNINANNTISPDGTLNADEYVGTSEAGLHAISVNSTVVNGQEYSFYVFIKKGSNDYIQLLFGTNNVTNNPYVNFDINNGLLQNNGVNYANIEDYGNGWYKCSATITMSGGTMFTGFIAPVESLSATRGVTIANNNFYIYGAQVEAGSFPTSYIKSNSGSATTRSAETANGAGDATTFSDSEGVLMVEFSSNNQDVGWIGLGSNSSNRVLLGQSAGNIRSYNNIGGTLINHQSTIDSNNNNKVAIKYKSGDTDFYINGFKAFESNSAFTVSTPFDEIQFKNLAGETQNFYGKTKQIQYYNSALTDSELEQLTSWISFTDMANGQLYTIE
mgnify:CR=1 FL=1